jgi:hypothetical protein
LFQNCFGLGFEFGFTRSVLVSLVWIQISCLTLQGEELAYHSKGHFQAAVHRVVPQQQQQQHQQQQQQHHQQNNSTTNNNTNPKCANFSCSSQQCSYNNPTASPTDDISQEESNMPSKHSTNIPIPITEMTEMAIFDREYVSAGSLSSGDLTPSSFSYSSMTPSSAISNSSHTSSGSPSNSSSPFFSHSSPTPIPADTPPRSNGCNNSNFNCSSNSSSGGDNGSSSENIGAKSAAIADRISLPFQLRGDLRSFFPASHGLSSLNSAKMMHFNL